jgi:RNA polymerase sigma factor (sigma-70 family)
VDARQAAQSDPEKRVLWTRLLEANVETIVQTARRFRGMGVPLSDLLQEGALALLTAIERVDFPDSMQIDRYAALVVEQRLTELVGSARDTAATSGGLLEHVTAPDPHDLRLEAEKIDKAHALLALLGRDEERVVRLRFGIDADEQPTLEAAARSLGMKRGRVSALENKALMLLRRAVHRLRWTFPR